MAKDLGHVMACRWFEQYCSELAFETMYEPEWPGIDKRPDYLVTKQRQHVVSEIKTFKDVPGRFRPDDGQLLIRDHNAVLKAVRHTIREAADRLKPLEGKGIPLVAVLADPLDTGAPLQHVVAVAFGDEVVELPLSSDGEEPRVTRRATRNGKLTNDHQYISATMVLERRSARQEEMLALAESMAPDELIDALPEFHTQLEKDPRWYLRATIVETPGKTATPLPEGFFAGERDIRWRLDESENLIKAGPATLGG